MKAIKRDEREMKDSGIEWIGKIPKKWKIGKLKNIAEISDGTHDTPEYVDEDNSYPLVTSKCIVDGKIDISLANHISERDYIEINKRSKVNLNDVIMPMIGTVGNPAIVSDNDKFAIKNVALIKTKGNYFLGRLIQYFLNSDVFIQQYDSMRRGGVQDFISQDKLRGIIIPIPFSYYDIVKYLDKICSSIDAIIAEAKSSIEEYKELKESVIYKATNYAKNGELYKKIQLRLICEVHGRIGFKGYTSADQVAEGEGALSFGATHLQNGKVVMNNPVYISWDKYYESPEIMVKKGDILLVQRGSTIGKVAIVDEEFGEATINPSLVLLNNIDINNKFLLYALLSLDVQQKVAMIGSTTAIPMISQAQVKALKIPMPSENEMVSVVCYLDEKISKIDDMISEKQALIEDLEAYKKSLIYEVVTGKRKVVA